MHSDQWLIVCMTDHRWWLSSGSQQPMLAPASEICSFSTPAICICSHHHHHVNLVSAYISVLLSCHWLVQQLCDSGNKAKWLSRKEQTQNSGFPTEVIFATKFRCMTSANCRWDWTITLWSVALEKGCSFCYLSSTKHVHVICNVYQRQIIPFFADSRFIDYDL